MREGFALLSDGVLNATTIYCTTFLEVKPEELMPTACATKDDVLHQRENLESDPSEKGEVIPPKLGLRTCRPGIGLVWFLFVCYCNVLRGRRSL